MIQSTHSLHSHGSRRISRAVTSMAADASLLAAGGTLLAMALLTVAAAGLLVAGGAGHSQLRLVA